MLVAAPDPLIVVVRALVRKAEDDLANAAHTLTLGQDCPADTASAFTPSSVLRSTSRHYSFLEHAFPEDTQHRTAGAPAAETASELDRKIQVH